VQGALERAASWAVFIAHAGADVAAARALAHELDVAHGVPCYLDAERLGGGDRWPTRLKEALASSRVIVVLVSDHSDAAYYQQEEVAIAIALMRDRPDVYRVVPVLVAGATQFEKPYGTFLLHHLQQTGDGWADVAATLAEMVAEAPRSPTESIVSSTRMVDDVWARLEPALTDRRARVPEEYRARFASADGDVVRLLHGTEDQRVTRDELEQRLSPEQLRHIEVLERSMAVNVALWEERYPERVLDGRSRRLAEAAVDALGEDLAGVLTTVEDAGLWLDDHYLEVRSIVSAHSRRP
jgi:hypothetical protein